MTKNNVINGAFLAIIAGFGAEAINLLHTNLWYALVCVVATVAVGVTYELLP